MADAGPSNPASSSRNATTPPSSVSKSSHIHFPHDNETASPNTSRKSDTSFQMASLGLGRPPITRRVTGTQGEGSSSNVRGEDIRPRVVSVEAPVSSPGPTRARITSELGITSSRRATPPTHRRGVRRGKLRGASAEPDVEGDNSYTLKTFSDEYDLANEGKTLNPRRLNHPRILEDVQHAIRMKARREARVKQSQANPSVKHATSNSDMASGSSFSPRSSPIRSTMPVLAPIVPPPADTFESEVDFSPSIGTIPLHPVPSSTNGGATLDWTVPNSEDEKADKRWRTLSIKRKPKEKGGPPSNKEVIEKQHALYTDKLSQIKANIQPLTFRKAAITRYQLERQYGALLTPNLRASQPNLLGAARWYDSQDDVVKISLDKAEPLTWLKHLIDKPGRRPTIRLPWHVTALILEEYLKLKHRPDAMETIPENGVVDSIVLRPSPGSLMYPGDKSPSSDSWSWTPPSNSLEPSLSRKRISADGQVSFEPVVDSGRESIGGDSKLSVDNPIASWIHSRPGGTASPRSSTQSSVFYSGWPQGPSPNNSRLNFRDLAQRMRRRPYGGSEDGLSSARNSMSEQSQDEEKPASRSRTKRRPRHSSLQLLSRSAPPTDDEKVLREHSDVGGEGAGPHSDGDVPSTAKPLLSTQSSPAAQKPPISRETSPKPRIAVPRLARKRVSLPSPNQLFLKEAGKRRQEADEEREHREYTHKAQMLEDTLSQNHRTRQVLQHVSAHMKEYDNVQSTLSDLMGVTHLRLPLDVLEAFHHDPSAVIGGTKRYKGWRAIDDIHERIVRQRQMLHAFVASLSEDGTPPSVKNVFEDPVTALMESLDQLEGHRHNIAREAETVAEALQRVKGIHNDVKKEYNRTLNHTSLIYPELSQIVTLEENYRNHYQQLWNIGLDALTLLLDTVTPFWRIYGKVIGEDAQDFLIIPWYRNEFTGEASWYPIKTFPKRSYRHWVGLLLFSVLSVAVTMLQLRAALSSTCLFNHPWLAEIGVRWLVFPFLTIFLIVQWCAVLGESLLLLAQTGIVVWWMGWSVRIFT